MLTTVKLYGHLGRKFGRRHVFNLSTIGEAVRAMEANYPGFRAHILKHNEPGYHIIHGKKELTVDELGMNVSQRVVRIVPAVIGAGKSPWVSIVVGVALIWATGGFAAIGGGAGLFGAAAAGSGLAAAYSIVGMVGVSMALGGVSQLLAGTPAFGQPVGADQKTSFGFDGAVNTEQQGVPVPVCYGGPIRVGGARICASVDMEDIGNTNAATGFRFSNEDEYVFNYDATSGAPPVITCDIVAVDYQGTPTLTMDGPVEPGPVFTDNTGGSGSFNTTVGIAGTFTYTFTCNDDRGVDGIVTLSKDIRFKVRDIILGEI